MGLMRIGLAVTGTLVGVTIGPTVTLRPDEIDVDVAPDELIAYFRARLATAKDEIIADDGDRLVRRFEGKAGPFPYRTVELVTYHLDGITFDHLAGPFLRCHERFSFDTIATGTRVIHTGTFRLKGGIWTAPLALTGVRRAFETHVRQHLEELATEIAKHRHVA
jgi:hypothetical protein